MPDGAFGRLWHDYTSAMAACLLQLHADGAAHSASERLVGSWAPFRQLHKPEKNTLRAPRWKRLAWPDGKYRAHAANNVTC